MNSEPVRLAKVEKPQKTTFEEICLKIAPYVLFVCICLLIITIFVIMVKYGSNITGTEANGYYYHMGV